MAGPTPDENSEINGNRPTVLIVDDEPGLAELYAEWLDSYEVIVAHGGRDALERTDDADIVLLDRQMPELTGDEVLERVRARESDCLVAMVTAVEPGVDIVELPFDTYLVKPVTREDLHETIDKLWLRRDYDVQFRRYFSAIQKRSLLLSSCNVEKLVRDEQFQALERRIDRLRDELQCLVDEFTAEDVAAVIGKPGEGETVE